MDDPGFARVLAEHAGLIRRIARSYEANDALAAELVQEICLSLWQALAKFRGESELRTFIVRVAHNRAITHVTKEAKRPRTVALDDEMPDSGIAPDHAAERAEKRRRLEAAVRRLPVGQRLVVTLALEGFTPEEIAGVLGIGVSAATVRLHRAKTALQQLLEEPNE